MTSIPNSIMALYQLAWSKYQWSKISSVQLNQESGISLSLNNTPGGIVLFPVIVVIDAWSYVSVFMDMPHAFSPTIITVSHPLVQSNSWKDVFSLVSLKLNAILICNLVLGGYVLLMKIMVTMFPMSILIGMDLSILRDVMAINLNMNIALHQYASSKTKDVR